MLCLLGTNVGSIFPSQSLGTLISDSPNDDFIFLVPCPVGYFPVLEIFLTYTANEALPYQISDCMIYMGSSICVFCKNSCLD